MAAEGLQPSRGHLPPEFDYRVILLGYRQSGKSSSGNTILGREEFDLKRTAQCVKRQGEVADRQLTVVEAPGWWMNVNLKATPELSKQEIVLSVSLCPPGPHIFLLHIRIADSVTSEYIENMMEHVNHLGEGVWSYTMLLFTNGDWLGDTPIEVYIESKGALQSLVEKCENRYHVLNNMEKGDRNQITELLEKMDEIICENGGRHYEMDRKRLGEVMKRREEDEERATARLMKVMDCRKLLQPLKRQLLPQSEFRIVLLGYRYSGKSSSGNTILGREEFDLKRTAQCVMRQGEVAGRQLTVVEAPGWWKNENSKATPQLIKQEIVQSVSLCPPGPHIFLLHVPLAIAVRPEYTVNMIDHVYCLTEGAWSHTMVLFTHGDWLGDTPIELYIESETGLQSLVEKCGNRYHVLNNMLIGDGKWVAELLEKMEEICGNGARHYEMDRKRLEEVMKRREEDEEQATARLMKVEEQRQHLQSLMRQLPSQAEFRVVLLGYRQSGKSSSGNTILGREEFDLKRRTSKCVKRQGEVAGRKLTVVEAPGWWKDIKLQATPELIKQEIVLSVCMCSPGPHIVLLHVSVTDALTPEYIENMVKHVSHVSEGVWNHVMVLFTCGDWLGDLSIEQYIQREGAIQLLIEKCGHRYHVLNNLDKGDRKQITELLEKMEEIICGNEGRHYEMDRKRLEEVEERRILQMKKAEDRQAHVHRQKSILTISLGDVPRLSDVRIVLVGPSDSGKSSSANTIMGREEFDLKRTAQCVKRQGEVAGRQVTVVDTPGWQRSFRDTFMHTRQEITQSLSLCPPGPHAIVLVICTALCFAEDDKKSVQDHFQIIGKNLWSHTVVMFTYGDWLGDTPIEEYIESSGESLQWVIEKCGNRYHVLNNKNWRDNTQVTELFKKIDEMVVRNGDSEYVKTKKTSIFNFLKWFKGDVLARDMDLQRRLMRMEWEVGPSVRTSGYGTCTSLGSYLASSYVDSEVLSEWSSQESIDNLGSGKDCVRSWTFTGSVTAKDTNTEGPQSRSHEEEDEDPGPSTATLPITQETDISTRYPHQPQSPTNCCKSCEDIEDTSDWILMVPAVSMATGMLEYSHCSPPGGFECTVSGLRWVCKEDISLQYHFSDPDICREELAMLQYTPIGPLMNIKVLSGELLEAHLPHFACLDGSDNALNEAVRVLHAVDGGVHLETCELTRFHAKLMNPSFSGKQVLVKHGKLKKTHLDVLIYQTRVKPLVLFTYVVPRDASMIKVVEKEIKKDVPLARKIKKHRPGISLKPHSKCSLKATCDARISPAHFPLEYIRPPDFFEVVIKNAEGCFDLELVSEGQSIWKATFESFEYEEMEKVPDSHKMSLAASGYSTEGIGVEEGASTSMASMTDETEKKMAIQSSQDMLTKIRPALVQRINGALLRKLVLLLESHDPPVLDSSESTVILQSSSVLTEQVTTVINMVLNKGNKASAVMLSLLQELDSFLCEDLGL